MISKEFLTFWPNPMDNHKLVIISIFFCFLKHEKDAIFMKICLENFLGFGRMHGNKKIFICFICFF
jgi:hypothetical protein